MKFIVALVLLFSCKAMAYVELNAFYFSDSLTVGSSSSNSRTFIEGSVGFAVDKEKRYNIGWNYSLFSASDTPAGGKTAAYSGTQMGPRFVWFMNRAFTWSLGLGYYLISKAKYDDGNGSTPEWRGSAFKVDIGYNMPVADDLYVGLRMNYSAATYSEQLVQSTTFSNVSYARTFIYPSIYSVYVF